MESLKHKFAKQTVARWLREVPYVQGLFPPLKKHWSPDRGAYVEYPICLNQYNEMIGVFYTWPPGIPPTYEECIARELLPLVIFDIAIGHETGIGAGIELVHKHEPSKLKLAYLRRIKHQYPHMQFWRLSADWVLTQPHNPWMDVVEQPSMLDAVRSALRT